MKIATLRFQETPEDKVLDVVPVNINGNQLQNGERRMPWSEFLALTQSKCPHAYDVCYKGRNQEATGATLFACGAGILLGTGLGYLVPEVRKDPSVKALDSRVSTVCKVFFGLSGICMIASIPFFVNGERLKRKSVQIYNQEYIQQKKSADFRFNVKGDGISLSYNF